MVALRYRPRMARCPSACVVRFINRIPKMTIATSIKPIGRIYASLVSPNTTGSRDSKIITTNNNPLIRRAARFPCRIANDCEPRLLSASIFMASPAISSTRSNTKRYRPKNPHQRIVPLPNTDPVQNKGHGYICCYNQVHHQTTGFQLLVV